MVHLYSEKGTFRTPNCFGINCWQGRRSFFFLQPKEIEPTWKCYRPGCCQDYKLVKMMTIFQQDGAPPHASLNVRKFLNTNLPNRWLAVLDKRTMCFQMTSKFTRPDCLRLFSLGIRYDRNLCNSLAPDHGWTVATYQRIHSSDYTRYDTESLDGTWLSPWHNMPIKCLYSISYMKLN